MIYKKIIILFIALFVDGVAIVNSKTAASQTISSHIILPISIQPIGITTTTDILEDINKDILEVELAKGTVIKDQKNTPSSEIKKSTIFNVPFYSQFTDITPLAWKKVGCGVASLAMLIEYYNPNSVTVDKLLEEGIVADAYLSDAGWSHKGLISLSNKYGLDGESYDMSGLSMDNAFRKLKEVLEEGPVMVSVHYTFDPKNVIPHLVVISGIKNDQVYYNDPAEKSGGGTISTNKFKDAWKKRYIEIRPSA